MARKSRKQECISITASPSEDIFKVGIYARLSKENGGKDDDGDSIENQVRICKEYVKERPYLKLVQVFKDNGSTGTNFNRDEFNAMLDLARTGKINCIVVKDLSRFGRDYVETGNYLEKVFPFLGIRFISITDNYDSFETDGSTEALMIPFKNMINELYAKDISRKIITSFRARQEKGQFLPAFVPYGYVKSKTVEYGLDIDTEVADNVRLIFKWKLEGLSYREIAQRLTDMGATTPSMRKVQLGVWHSEKHKRTEWSRRSLIDILKDYTYTGTLVYGKMPKSFYEGIKEHRASFDEWRCIPNHHEAIISKEVYDVVKKMFDDESKRVAEIHKKSEKARASIVDIFEGKMFCGDCGRNMRFYRRSYNKKYGHDHYLCAGYIASDGESCSKHRMDYGTVKELAMNQIKVQIQYFADMESVLKKLKNDSREKDVIEALNADIRTHEASLKRIGTKQGKLFESFCEGILSNDEYLYTKKTYEEEYAKEEQILSELGAHKLKIQQVLNGDSKWLKAFNRVSKMDSITKELVDEFIKEIKVYDIGSGVNVEIIMNYDDEQRKLKEVYEELVKEGKINDEI